MIDFKKLQFLSALKEIITNNPDYAGDAINSITEGAQNAIVKAKTDNRNLSAMLMLAYMANKHDKKISKKAKLKIIELLSKQFDLSAFDRPEVTDLFENWNFNYYDNSTGIF